MKIAYYKQLHYRIILQICPIDSSSEEFIKIMKPADKICILIIDEHDNRAEALSQQLNDTGYSQVVRSCNSSDLLQQVEKIAPDIVLVEIDNPKRDILEQLATLNDTRPTPVAVFCQDAEAQSIRAAVESGVCAYVVEGVQPTQVKTAISLAMSTFKAMSSLRDEANQAKEALAERQKIDRAKRVLMKNRGLTEEQAYQTLKKFAMDRQKKLVDASDDLLAIMNIFGNQN